MNMKTDTTLSDALHAAEEALQTPASTALVDTPQTQAVAEALAQTNPPPAPVFTGHTQGLFGEISAKANTLKLLIEDLDSTAHQVGLDADAAIAALEAKRAADLAQLGAERSNALKAWSVLSECANVLAQD